MPRVLETVYGADGLILASPVYWENVSSQMKVFMDRAATRYYHEERLTPEGRRPGRHRGRDGAQRHAERPCAASWRCRAARSYPILKPGRRADKPGEAAADAQLMAEARNLGRAMAARLGRDEVEPPA